VQNQKSFLSIVTVGNAFLSVFCVYFHTNGRFYCTTLC